MCIVSRRRKVAQWMRPEIIAVERSIDSHEQIVHANNPDIFSRLALDYGLV